MAESGKKDWPIVTAYVGLPIGHNGANPVHEGVGRGGRKVGYLSGGSQPVDGSEVELWLRLDPVELRRMTRRAANPSGADLIAAERTRQILDEDFSAAHDDRYTSRELGTAALCYLREALSSDFGDTVPLDWPLDEEWWKPSERVDDLVKAGALIAAEIDRLRRASTTPKVLARGVMCPPPNGDRSTT